MLHPVNMEDNNHDGNDAFWPRRFDRADETENKNQTIALKESAAAEKDPHSGFEPIF
jgi:hypothetical protein